MQTQTQTNTLPVPLPLHVVSNIQTVCPEDLFVINLEQDFAVEEEFDDIEDIIGMPFMKASM